MNRFSFFAAHFRTKGILNHNICLMVFRAVMIRLKYSSQNVARGVDVLYSVTTLIFPLVQVGDDHREYQFHRRESDRENITRPERTPCEHSMDCIIGPNC